MATESLEEKVQRLEKMVQRTLDVQEIQNVMSRHSFLDAQGKNREQVMEIFVQTVPNVSFAMHNIRVYKGLGNIIHYFGFVTGIMGGKLQALWMWERFATDFIKENGKWKIWYFNGMIQFASPYEKSWVTCALKPAHLYVNY